jgi:hypothetical protein
MSGRKQKCPESEVHKRRLLLNRWRREGRLVEVKAWIESRFQESKYAYPVGQRGNAMSEAYEAAKYAFPPLGVSQREAAKNEAADRQRRSKARTAEHRAYWHKRHWKRAGESTDLGEFVRWTLKWLPLAEVKGDKEWVIAWERITESPPGHGAMTIIERCAENPDFLKSLLSKQPQKGEQSGLSEDQKRVVVRSEEELKAMLGGGV